MTLARKQKILYSGITGDELSFRKRPKSLDRTSGNRLCLPGPLSLGRALFYLADLALEQKYFASIEEVDRWLDFSKSELIPACRTFSLFKLLDLFFFNLIFRLYPPWCPDVKRSISFPFSFAFLYTFWLLLSEAAYDLPRIIDEK